MFYIPKNPTKCTNFIATKLDHKVHFISGAISYMFRHQGGISREFLSFIFP